MVSSYQNRLNEAMTDAGIGVGELARRLGLTYQAVRKVTIGTTKSFNADNNAKAARELGISPDWLANGSGDRRASLSPEPPHLEHSGSPRTMRRVPVVGTARLGENGYYEELQHPPGFGDGWVDGYSADPNAYALRVKGDSMHPAIRHGSFVVVEPNGACVPGEYVVILMRDGRKMVKELVIERPGEIVVESVNGNRRLTFEKVEIDRMHAVAAVVAPSKWRPE